MNNLTKLARSLRKNATSQENKMWQLLRNHRYKGLEFRRQQPIGKYIVDFVCRDKWLIIELDGGQHNADVNMEYDNKRTRYLQELGFTVLRFWNNEIDNNLSGVLEVIDKYTN